MSEKDCIMRNMEVPFVAYETERERVQEEKLQMRKHYAKIIYSLIALIFFILASIVGGIIWFFSNYDIGVMDFTQSIDMNDGTATIKDGIEYNNSKS